MKATIAIAIAGALLLLPRTSVSAQVAVQVSPSQRTASDSVEITRIAGLARVWAAVRFLHPWMAYRENLNLDSSTIAAIAAVRAARITGDFELALGAMLAPLNDPATRILQTAAQSGRQNRWAARSGARDPTSELLRDSILVIGLHRYSDVSEVGEYEDVPRPVKAIRQRLAAAHAVIFDLRTDETPPRPFDDVLAVRDVVERLLHQLTTRNVTPPAQRGVVRIGFARERLPGEDGAASSGTFFQVGPTRAIGPDAGARDVRIVLVVNANSEVPAYGAALIRDGLAGLVTEGELGDAPYVSYRDFDAGEGVRVRVRTSEIVDSAGQTVAPPTAVVTRGVRGDDDPAIARALALLHEPWPLRTTAGARLPALIVQRSPFVPLAPMPAAEARIFAAVKLWEVITTFYPSFSLNDKPWSGALAEFIRRMRDASNVTEYQLALAALMSQFRDSHASVVTPELEEWRGQATLPLRLAVVQGRLVVINVGHDSLLAGARIRRGDVIRTIDGEDALTRARRISDTGSNSTLARRDLNAGVHGGRGPVGSTASLAVEDVSGKTRTVRVPRHPLAQVRADIMSRFPPPVRMVARDIGYIDPSRVPWDSADAAFDKLRDARAIIFEWRESTGDTFPFVSRLVRMDSIPATVSAPFIGSLGGGWGSDTGTITRDSWCLCRNTTRHYSGQAVLLTGPRAQSSMEVNADFLKKANGTPFIGAPTSGTLGGITYLYVPGGIRLGFTSGNGPDRRGLQPDVPVTVTITGIRAGRDEVLDAAVAYLRRQLAR